MYGEQDRIQVNENEKKKLMRNAILITHNVHVFFPVFREKIETDIKYPFARDSELPDEIIMYFQKRCKRCDTKKKSVQVETV